MSISWREPRKTSVVILIMCCHRHNQANYPSFTGKKKNKRLLGVKMAIFLGGFFRCVCGKMHTAGGISYGSVCSCGAKLFEQMADKAPVVKNTGGW